MSPNTEQATVHERGQKGQVIRELLRENPHTTIDKIVELAYAKHGLKISRGYVQMIRNPNLSGAKLNKLASTSAPGNSFTGEQLAIAASAASQVGGLDHLRAICDALGSIRDVCSSDQPEQG